MVKIEAIGKEDRMPKLRRSFLACALMGALALAPLAGCASQSASTSATDSATASAADSTDASSTATTSSAVTADATSSEQEVSAAKPTSDHFILYLGTNDKDTNEPVYSREESRERAKAILIKHLGGYTIQDAEGGWVDDSGKVYQEYTLVIHLSDTDIETVHAVADDLIKEFNQSSVLINTEQVTSEFYYSGTSE